MAEIPTPFLMKDIQKRFGADKFPFKSFNEYHQWYLNNDIPERTPQYKNEKRWPCILSGFDDEVFEDGWHRFHSYYRSKHMTIPVVYFMEESPTGFNYLHKEEKEEHSTDCRSDEGIIIGLIDGMIAMARIIRKHREDNTDTPAIKAALNDLREDEDINDLKYLR
jgi:hypothetical protein